MQIIYCEAFIVENIMQSFIISTSCTDYERIIGYNIYMFVVYIYIYIIQQTTIMRTMLLNFNYALVNNTTHNAKLD